MNNNIKFNIEQPSNEDLFTGNGHLSSALAIKRTIEQQTEINIIGLEGELGAGKSSIIKMLESELDERYKFIYFDISTYYHGSLKSEFIKFFSKELLNSFNGIVNKEAVDSATNRALGKTFVYKKETQSNINWFVFIFALSIIFSVRYFNDALNILASTLSSLFSSNPYNPSINATVTFLLGMSPLLTLCFNYFNNRKRIKNGTSPNLIGDLLKRNGSDTITETLLINKEVGGYELKEAFEEMLKEIPDDNTVILVLDNIDRIEKDKLGEIWSDIDIFSSAGSECFKIILPFSEKHVSQALNSDDPNEGKEYISKKLPVVFKAPPVVTANWRELFETHWNESLSKFNGMEQSQNLIGIWKNPATQVTPRLIKKHINDIASVVACNLHITNAAFCSAYILACKNNGVDIAEFLSNPVKENEISKKIIATHRILDKFNPKDEWVTGVTCIHYQTSADIARSELLDEPIRNGLLNNNCTEVINLSEIYGYDIVLKKIADEVGYIDCIKLCSTALNSDHDYSEWIEEWMSVFNVLPDAKSTLLNIDEQFIQSIRSLKKNKYRPSTESLIKYFNKLIDDNNAYDSEHVTELYLCYTALKDECEIPKTITSPSSDTFLALWENRNELIEWNIQSINIGTDVFIESLEKNLSKEKLDFSFMRWGMKFFSLGNDRPYELIEGSNKISISVDSDAEPDSLMCLPYTKEWYNPDIMSKTYTLYKELFSDNGSNLVKNKQGSLHCVIASLILTQIVQFNHYESEITYYDSKTTGYFTEKTSDIVKALILNSSYDAYQPYIYELINSITKFSLLHNALTSDIQEVYREPIRLLINSKNFSSLDIKDVIHNKYDVYRDVLNSETEVSDFIGYLYDWKDNYDKPQLHLWPISFINDALRYDYKQWGNFFEEQLVSISNKVSFWLQAFTKESNYLAAYASWLIENKQHIPNQSIVVDAMKTLYKNTTSFSEDELGKQSIIKLIFESLELKSQKSLMRYFGERIIQLGVNQSEKLSLIATFGSVFKLKATRDVSIQESYISLLEATTNEKILTWFSAQDLKISQWSDENIIELDNALSDEPYKTKLSNLKALTTKLCSNMSANDSKVLDDELASKELT
ncbi:P-loop NTPase fold protein [Aeromonas piscicola]|uniref:P-loop NTPase fold protein n=1 Tax=Aeromonas piscicola TaxID=600645 RepID=A0ABT7Q8S6_9GAMM|nr:P-loop NTPase fold protein [Aeromonas piscicola]MDM5130054.1 P-loop NTPase fold protein [Aeromonas piscicola]